MAFPRPHCPCRAGPPSRRLKKTGQTAGHVAFPSQAERFGDRSGVLLSPIIELSFQREAKIWKRTRHK
jgi:hypothetical protein